MSLMSTVETRDYVWSGPLVVPVGLYIWQPRGGRNRERERERESLNT